MTSASDVAPAGTPDQASGGGWLAPSQVNWRGIAAPSANAALVSRTVAAVAVVEVASLAEPPPPELHATAVTRRPRASLRSTGLFYPERGHVADHVETSAVTDDTEAREAEGVVVEAAGLDPIDTRTILRAGGPRFIANAGFPVLFFYVGWKLSGLLLGVVLATAVGIGAFVIVNVITGFPIVAGLMSWSVWYITRFFRRSEEWGTALAAR